MADFIALFTGKGDGCDYTIGCNRTWKFIHARNMEEALEDAAGDVDDRIDCVEVIEISKKAYVNVAEIEENRRKMNSLLLLEKKKEEYEKLKKELGL